MRRRVWTTVAAALFASPAQALDWRGDIAQVRPGTFVGVRLKLQSGGNSVAKPTAALTLAPTQSRISSTGLVRTRIGEGLALSFAPSEKVTLRIGGVRADTALGLSRGRTTVTDNKFGISTAGWIAIGAGVTVVGLGVAYLVVADMMDCSDEDDCD